MFIAMICFFFFTKLRNMKLHTNRKEWKESPDSPLLRNERIVKNHLCVVVVERTNLKSSRWFPEICFKQVWIKLCQIWQMDCGLRLDCCITMHCNDFVKCHVCFALCTCLLRNTWKRQTCTSSGKLLKVIGQMKVILVATESSEVSFRRFLKICSYILITFFMSPLKYLFLIAWGFCQVCNPFSHLSRTFCFGCGLRSFWENPFKSAWSWTGVLRWVSGGEGSPYH